MTNDSLIQKLEALQEPFAVHETFEKLTCGERQVLNACLDIIRQHVGVEMEPNKFYHVEFDQPIAAKAPDQPDELSKKIELAIRGELYNNGGLLDSNVEQLSGYIARDVLAVLRDDEELLEEYERAKGESQESCTGAHNSYGCGYDSGYREGIRFAIYRGKADGK